MNFPGQDMNGSGKGEVVFHGLGMETYLSTSKKLGVGYGSSRWSCATPTRDTAKTGSGVGLTAPKICCFVYHLRAHVTYDYISSGKRTHSVAILQVAVQSVNTKTFRLKAVRRLLTLQLADEGSCALLKFSRTILSICC